MRMTALLTATREPGELPASAGASAALSVQSVYEAHFDFVWRTARRLGVRPPQLDDIVQEVFMVVQRRLPDFEGRSSLRTWLYAITRHVVRAHYRLNARRSPALCIDAAEACDPSERGPESLLVASEARKLLYALLDELDDDKREVFVLAQLEEMTGPEIAQALELPLSNVYARIVAAQKAFDRALGRHRARQRGNS